MMKKTISLILALVLCMSICVPALADNTETKVKQFSSYVSMGDSIACGYNAENLLNRENMYWVVNDMSYCWQVADAVGCARENIYAEGASFCGARIIELCMLIGAEGKRDAYNGEGCFFGARLDNMLENYAETCQEKISETELITVNIGGNDLTNYALHVTGLMDGEGREVDAELAEELISLIWEGYENLCYYYPKFLDRIRELNSDATVLLTGIFNPMYDAKLSEDLPLAVTSALSTVLALVNEQIKEWAEEYGAIYVDVDDAESYFNTTSGEASTILGGVDNLLLYVHPTEEGYKYYARQMIAALTEGNKKPLSTNVNIDLNGLNGDKIIKVLVDGMSASYTVNDKYSMTVKCSTPTANTLTVVALNGTKLQIFVWHLDWNVNDGYSASILTKSGDAAQMVNDVVSAAVKGISSLFAKFKK